MSSLLNPHIASSKQHQIDNLKSSLSQLITAIENYQELERVGLLDYIAKRELEEATDRAKRELKNNET